MEFLTLRVRSGILFHVYLELLWVPKQPLCNHNRISRSYSKFVGFITCSAKYSFKNSRVRCSNTTKLWSPQILLSLLSVLELNRLEFLNYKGFYKFGVNQVHHFYSQVRKSNYPNFNFKIHLVITSQILLIIHQS